MANDVFEREHGGDRRFGERFGLRQDAHKPSCYFRDLRKRTFGRRENRWLFRRAFREEERRTSPFFAQTLSCLTDECITCKPPLELLHALALFFREAKRWQKCT